MARHKPEGAGGDAATPDNAVGRAVVEQLLQLEARSAPGLAADVMPVFLRDRTVRLAALRDATERADGVEAHRAAHTIHGSILANASSDLLRAGRVIAMSHHERWDGSGYPAGLAGEDIPLWGRICAVADTFDAVTSERAYKPAHSNDTALAILQDGRGTQFDPKVVDAFLACYEQILEVQSAQRD